MGSKFAECNIAHLPPKVLRSIFRTGIHQYPRPASLDDEFSKLPSMHRENLRFLLAITHACHRWREIALEDALLWTGVDDLDERRMTAFVERSKNMGISFLITKPFARHPVLETVSKRLRRLDVTSVKDPRTLSIPAPMLEAFVAIGKSDPLDRGQNVFTRSAASLKALALPRLPVNHFPSLTHLYLLGSPNSVQELQKFLTCTPLLESLHLSHRHKADINLSLKLVQPVPLPHLRSLCICGAGFHHASAITGSLSLPSNVTIRLHELTVGEGEPARIDLFDFTFIRGLTRLAIAGDSGSVYILAEGPNSGVWIQARSPHARGISAWEHHGLHLKTRQPYIAKFSVYE